MIDLLKSFDDDDDDDDDDDKDKNFFLRKKRKQPRVCVCEVYFKVTRSGCGPCRDSFSLSNIYLCIFVVGEITDATHGTKRE